MSYRSHPIFTVTHPLIIAASVGLSLVGMLTISHQTARADDAKKTASADPVSPSAGPRLRYRIVVDQGKWNEIRNQQWNIPPEVGAGIQAQLIDKLEKSGYFIVMEREATAQQQASAEDTIDAIKRASILGLINSGAVPDSTPVPAAPAPTAPAPTAPPARQQRTVGNFIITPSVVGFTTTGEGGGGFNLNMLNLGNKKSESTVTLNIRISDAQTSEIIDTQMATGKAESKSSGGGIKLNVGSLGMGTLTSEQFQNSPAGQAVDQALDDAVAKIVTRLSKEPWTAMVATQDKTTNRVIVNAGTQSGVEVGQIFDVYRAGAPVLDPDTQEKISDGDQVKVGRIKVTRVERNASYADVLDGTTFQARDIVKAIDTN